MSVNTTINQCHTENQSNVYTILPLLVPSLCYTRSYHITLLPILIGSFYIQYTPHTTRLHILPRATMSYVFINSSPFTDFFLLFLSFSTILFGLLAKNLNCFFFFVVCHGSKLLSQEKNNFKYFSNVKI